MTQINDPSNLGTDLFGYKINYNQVQGLAFPNSDFSNLEVKPKYNGNIAEVSWKTLTEENEPLKRYGYVYDGLNRLQAGFYQKDTNPSAQEYFEKIDYDLNGNISRLKRSAELSAGSTTALMIDNLKYDYTGNRLTKVTEEQIGNNNGYPYWAAPNTITYDDNGNMKDHLDKGISSIQYNYLNLPRQITQSSKITQYTYRADGTKVKKLFGDIETDYLDGFQYKSTKPSEGSLGGGGIVIVDPNEVAEMKLRIIPTAEGYFDVLNNQYIYNYTDHLGNVRLSYTDTNKDGIIQPRQYFWQQCDTPTLPWEPPICINGWKPGEIVEVNNYYPFGMLHNYTTTTQNAYQYKYNGKELQETGMYDYGARFYMPDLGRWGVIDNKAEKYSSYSSYNYVLNNPINAIDPDGNEIIFVRVIDENTQIQLQYKNGNFYYLNGDKKGEKYDGRKDRVSSNLFRLARAYRKIEKSNNDILKGMLHKLEESDKKHYIFDPINNTDGSGVGGTPQGGSKTVYDFSKFQKELFEDMEGVPTSDFVEVVHEMRHQYDRDIDNNSDSKGGADASNPMEQRAVKAENEARKLEGLPLRTTYGKIKVNPNPPNYKLPTDENKHK